MLSDSETLSRRSMAVTAAAAGKPSPLTALLARWTQMHRHTRNLLSGSRFDPVAESKIRVERADTLVAHGQRYGDFDAMVQAAQEYRQALRLLDGGGHDIRTAELQWRLASILYEIGWNRAELRSLGECVSVCRELLAHAKSETPAPADFHIYRLLGDASSELAHLQTSALHFRQAVDAYVKAAKSMEAAGLEEDWCRVQANLAHCWEELSVLGLGTEAGWNALEAYEALAVVQTRRCRFAMARIMRDKARELRSTLAGER
ncbi:MAG: hypothetical protein GYB36_05640 [Alphaproteobacteria bacterium]|nr:hypothetical protein [Alphaproteobacteria bacterium]